MIMNWTSRSHKMQVWPPHNPMSTHCWILVAAMSRVGIDMDPAWVQHWVPCGHLLVPRDPSGSICDVVLKYWSNNQIIKMHPTISTAVYVTLPSLINTRFSCNKVIGQQLFVPLVSSLKQCCVELGLWHFLHLSLSCSAMALCTAVH
jgi:hypothetical protein